MAELIEIQTSDGTAEAYLARPEEGVEVKGGVLFFMDAIGLRPRIAEMVDRIASWGYIVLAPNVFYRWGTAEELEPKGSLMDPESRAAFFASGVMDRVNGLTSDLAAVDTVAYVATLQSYVGPELPLATTGYCMGARLAIRAAGQFPGVVVAVAGFHGGGLVTDAPDSPHTVVTGEATYLFGHADNDGSMTPENAATLDAALTAAGATFTSAIYPGSPHGYSMTDTSSYDEAGEQRHWAELEPFLAETLG
ncbi:dienelactone hydrolase family protein [Nocardioides sp. Kera G14]|uniref:dienelactone hydrolase family protein n=1 Tax=Nocardioides sp. Kera G14 TaxID=2884264 RepID=UPI001D10F6B2|nr:dienelactone hydrolase family protein [Nocardioides sp. Kera G14]UDY22765.1 dienelactone hydrolase family protein [Nocardioides sp. Kera G14]